MKPFDTTNALSIKKYLQENNLLWAYNPDEKQDEEIAYFFFLGEYKGKEVLFDVALMPLYLHYMAVLEEKADIEAQKVFPDYKGYESNLSEKRWEEIWEFKAEVIAELEAEGELKVQEFIEYDDEDYDKADAFVLMTVALNRTAIDKKTIDNFVKSYKAGTLQLDKNLYAFSLEEE
ncbi:MAG: hypothetical protein NZ516_01205 [Raineya sp.]|nr:hypothetical protein [Raineya sp.]